MSIEYFVEGKIKIEVKGDYKVFSKGNINFNSENALEQSATESGVSYNKAKTIHPNDKPVNFLDVSLNLFFDGTQNNKTNTEARNTTSRNHQVYLETGNKNDDSYENEYSNIARGFDAIDPDAQNQLSWYIEGIGTEDLESDTVFPGVALGMGSTGVQAKVVKGCIKGAEVLKKKYEESDIVISTLKVNVYGFSRGATAARHFLHIATSPALTREDPAAGIAGALKSDYEIIRPPYPVPGGEKRVKRNHPLVEQYGYFGACLAYTGLTINKILFNFVGLYDTVASYGVDHRGKKVAGMPLIEDDTKQLGLNAVKKAYFVLQLASDDEYRDNFDLTNIDSAGLHGLEFTLPGVHSDIGGSYLNDSEELSVLYCEVYDVYKNPKTHKECEAFKKIVVEEGWYNEDQLEIRHFYQKDVGYDKIWNKGLMYYGLIGRRKLYNTYDRIPLNQMFHYSSQFGVEYINERINKKHSTEEDPFIHRVYGQLVNYMNTCNTFRNGYVEQPHSSAAEYVQGLKKISYLDKIDENDLKILRGQYLHWSVKANQIGLDVKPYDNGPKKKGALENKHRKRNIQNG
ncbi:phospholipase effector Tle1 domain-containing protein [Chryseobacterium sp. c4a]|uniref:phospholipase effector Tle1 domain-containing protein n=1 Tax=Chryseobacterium sp. c4a TaxID=1573582 RepID=UPI00135B1C46|nr:DUF2235 domain-containing protein [Chryseobacterium sp. c4a]